MQHQDQNSTDKQYHTNTEPTNYSNEDIEHNSHDNMDNEIIEDNVIENNIQEVDLSSLPLALQDFHHYLIDCISEAGFPVSKLGTCYGYCRAAAVYFFMDKSQDFIDKKNELNQYRNQDIDIDLNKRTLNDMKSLRYQVRYSKYFESYQNEILIPELDDIMAYLRIISQLQNPTLTFKSFQEKNKFDKLDLPTISDGVKITGFYTKEDLIDYFKAIVKLLNTINIKVCFIINTHNHAHSFLYDPIVKELEFRDANLNSINITVEHDNDDDVYEIAEAIVDSIHLSFNIDNEIAITTEICTERKHENELNYFINELKVTDIYKRLHNDLQSVKDKTTSENVTLLMLAACNNDIEMVKELCQTQTIDINLTNHEGLAALYYALCMNNTESVKELLNYGASPYLIDKYGNTGLSIAADFNNTELMKLLISKDKEILNYTYKSFDKKDEKENLNVENTIMHYAAYYCDTNVITLLIEYGIDINVRNAKGETPLMLAVQNRSKEFVDFLLEKGADLLCKDNDNKHALIHAIQSKKTDCIQSLITNETINLKDKDGITPLMEAVLSNNIDSVKLFLDKDVDMNVQDGNGRTALMFSLMHPDFSSIFELLISKEGVNVNLIDSDGFSALFYAIMITIESVYVKSLVTEITMNTVTDLSGTQYTPLMFAASRNYTLGIELLLGACENNIDKNNMLNKQNNKGKTAIMIAIKKGHDNIKEILLEHGATLVTSDLKKPLTDLSLNPLTFYASNNRKRKSVENEPDSPKLN